MAVSIGMFQLAIARNLHRRRADEWFFGVAGAASVCFAAAFVALAFRWIRLEPGTHPDLLLFGAYFTVTAVCMLVLGLRLHSWRALQL
jgi:hypothetical protein